MTERQRDAPEIELVQEDGEITLLIDGGQAMQGWERDLMWESADILCTYGRDFLEIGLGLGISALRIAENPATRRHTVVEKYPRVVELFHEQHPALPATLEIVVGDFFDVATELEPESVDGIFFDPYFGDSSDILTDEALWARVVPPMVRALRPGGVLIPFFSMRPVLRWQFVPYFDRVVVERRSFEAYSATEYTSARTGHAFIQCFVKNRDQSTST